MTLTHAHAKIRVAKAAARSNIAALRAELAQLIQRVPPHVIDGSHQVAVAWRDAAEQVMSLSPPVGGWASLDRLQGDVTALTELRERLVMPAAAATA